MAGDFLFYLNILPQWFHKSLVCFSWICFFNPFFIANVRFHVTHTAIYFHGCSMSYMFQYSFKCVMLSCLTEANYSLYWLWHLHIVDCLFSCFFSLFFHILLHYLFLLLNNNVLIVIFNLILWGAFTRDWFTCFIDVIVYFLLFSEHFATIILQEFSVLFIYNFFNQFVNANVWLHVRHTG